jgi:hypothetical protein
MVGWSNREDQERVNAAMPGWELEGRPLVLLVSAAWGVERSEVGFARCQHVSPRAQEGFRREAFSATPLIPKRRPSSFSTSSQRASR